MRLITLLSILAVSFFANTYAVAQCTINRNINITITKPDSLYTDHGDSTVSDNETGLMWQKCTLGLSGSDCLTGINNPPRFTWQAALAVANNNTDYGYGDWRLPNRNELESLMEDACITGINSTIFPAVLSEYWTSTPYAGFGFRAWYITFTGVVTHSRKNEMMSVRLVRGG